MVVIVANTVWKVQIGKATFVKNVKLLSVRLTCAISVENVLIVAGMNQNVMRICAQKKMDIMNISAQNVAIVSIALHSVKLVLIQMN